MHASCGGNRVVSKKMQFSLVESLLAGKVFPRNCSFHHGVFLAAPFIDVLLAF